MYDSSAKLWFNVIPDKRQVFLLEAGRPGRVAGNENRDVVDEADARFQGAVDVTPRGIFGTYRQVV